MRTIIILSCCSVLLACSGAGFAPANLIDPPPDDASADTKLAETKPDAGPDTSEASEAGELDSGAKDSAIELDSTPPADSAPVDSAPVDSSTVVDSSSQDACSVPTLAANQSICAPGHTYISTCLGAGCTWWGGQIECCP